MLSPNIKDLHCYPGTLGCRCFWIFNLDENGNQKEWKKIKNVHSYRPTPIHLWLIDGGFLEYVESKKIEEGSLFDLKSNRYQGYQKSADKIYSKDIIRLGRALGIVC